MNDDKGILKVIVRDGAGRHVPIKGAKVLVYSTVTASAKQRSAKQRTGATYQPEGDVVAEAETDAAGSVELELDAGSYRVAVDAFTKVDAQPVKLEECDCACLTFNVPLGLEAEITACRSDAPFGKCEGLFEEGTPLQISAQTSEIDRGSHRFLHPVMYQVLSSRGVVTKTGERQWRVDTNGVRGPLKLSVTLRGTNSPVATVEEELYGESRPTQPISGNLSVTLGRTTTAETSDMPLWTVIRAATAATSFNNYKTFIDDVMCGKEPEATDTTTKCANKSLPYPGVDRYSLVKCATEVFLMAHCGVVLTEGFTELTINMIEEKARFGREITKDDLLKLWSTGASPYLVGVNGGEAKTLPYLALIRSKLGDVQLKDDMGNGTTSTDVANCYGILQEKLTKPCLIELIWSYWHEEGMLVQAMKAISMRFQNKRGRAEVEPLMRFDIDPLRPLSNLLWGYIQDEQHRLTIVRRAYEYDHHYGISLQGRAVPSLRPVDGRSKFLEAYHNLLYLCAIFFKEDDDTTVIADGFPVLNGIREVHLLLAEGAHNQFGDLPSTARQEMLIEQWLLARPEMREFLGGRIMVPYPETWMDRVDTVKKIEGWTDTNITDFHYLAVFGEQILLSIRYGHWTDVNDAAHAANWARYWRSEMQGYIHSYRAVTGVDLTQDVTEPRQVSQRYAQPSVHLRRRLDTQLASKR